MPRYEVVGPRPVAGAQRGEVVDLDPDRVNIPALIEAGHVRPIAEPKSRKERAGD